MNRVFIILLTFTSFAFGADGNSYNEIIGRIVSGLSQNMSVSVMKVNDVIWIHGNSFMGRVSYAKGMTKDSGVSWENEFVPTDNGVVIKVYPEFDLPDSQKAWGNFTDENTRKFERLIPTQGSLAIGIIGSHGKAITMDMIDKVIVGK